MIPDDSSTMDEKRSGKPKVKMWLDNMGDYFDFGTPEEFQKGLEERKKKRELRQLKKALAKCKKK